MAPPVDPRAATQTSPGPALAEPAGRLEPGDWIGRYRVQRCIDRGGMGVVYEAIDESLGRRVAIKRLLTDRDPEVAARLVREARAAAGISHPNIVAVYEVGVDDTGPFMAMEHVDGMTLEHWLATPRTVREIVDVFVQAGRGLAAAHRAGLVHRDVKPSNILVGLDRVRIADFGLARRIARPGESGRAAERSAAESIDDVVHEGAVARPSESRVTRTGAIAGTPGYMAPEQREGNGPLDARADQYAFCVSFAQALAGEPPTVERVPALPVKTPSWLRGVIERGLQPDREQRFASMDEMLARLVRTHSSPWTLVAAVGGGAAAIAAVLVVTLGAPAGEPSTPACRNAEDKLAGVWDPDARTRVAAAFHKLPASYATATHAGVESALDRYAAEWAAMAREACEATRVHGTQSEELLDRRVACLDQRRAALRVLVRAFATIDQPSLDSAPNAVRNLPRIADCGDRAYVMSGPRTSLAMQFGEDLMQARMHLVAARDHEGLAAAKRAIATAQAAGDRAREAEALVVQGRLQLYIDGGAAVTTLGSAVDIAGKAGATGVQIDAWGFLAQGYMRVGQMTLARDVLELAFAALRDHPDSWREGDLYFARGGYFGRSGKFEDARRDLERALQLYIEVVGPDSQFLNAVHANLGIALKRLGRIDEALEQAQTSLRLSRQLGEHHQATIDARVDVAIALAMLGRDREARDELERAAASARTTHGEHHEQVGIIEGTLGEQLMTAGQWRAAHEHLARAVAILDAGTGDPSFKLGIRAKLGKATSMIGNRDEGERIVRDALAERTRVLGADHPSIGETHRLLGETLLAQGRVAAALEEYARARAILEKALGPTHPQLAHALVATATAERTRGKHAAALALDQRALAIFESALPATHPDLATTRLALARDHSGLQELPRARELAEQSLATFESRGDLRGIALAHHLLARADPARSDEHETRSLEALERSGLGADDIARLLGTP